MPELSEDDLETIIAIARNKQSGRITEREIRILVHAYRTLLAIGRAQLKEAV